jgi:hypothetical protein
MSAAASCKLNPLAGRVGEKRGQPLLLFAKGKALCECFVRLMTLEFRRDANFDGILQRRALKWAQIK